MSERKCSIYGCDSKHTAKGLCGKHYQRAFKQERYGEFYVRWQSIKNRCFNKNNRSYKYYGNRGITVCDEWLEYGNFKDWATENNVRPGQEVDRIDNDGNYSPCNCRVVSHAVNSRNSRATVLTDSQVSHIKLRIEDGHPIKEIAKEHGVSSMAIYKIKEKRTWSTNHDAPL